MTHPFVQAYHSYQIDLAVLFGADPTRAATEMRAALDFEIELAEVRLELHHWILLRQDSTEFDCLDFTKPRRAKRCGTVVQSENDSRTSTKCQFRI